MQFLSGMDEGKARLAKGHIHTGNIFLDGDVCQLGGLENMLLGCRPRDHWKFDDYKNMMDIFMLGECALLRHLNLQIYVRWMILSNSTYNSSLLEGMLYTPIAHTILVY